MSLFNDKEESVISSDVDKTLETAIISNKKIYITPNPLKKTNTIR